MNLYWNQVHKNNSIPLATNSLHLRDEKLAVIFKNYTEIQCKHVPADGVVPGRPKQDRDMQISC